LLVSQSRNSGLVVAGLISSTFFSSVGIQETARWQF
jgi:hypothetical protein